jgi:hypothetical protein
MDGKFRGITWIGGKVTGLQYQIAQKPKGFDA